MPTHPTTAVVPGEPIVDASVRDLGALATIVLLVFAVLHVMWLARHRRLLEARLDEAHAEIEQLRHRLADVSRPPAQFARMRLREEAVYRFARLRRAVPRRRRAPEPLERLRQGRA